MRIATYEDWGAVNYSLYLPEAYSGGDIIMWQGTIERQIENMVQRAEESGNNEYATNLRTFLSQWRDNQLTGSLNIETLRSLKIAAEWASMMDWNFKNYFSLLRDQLRSLIARVGEELPVMPQQEQPKAKGGPRGSRVNTDLGSAEQFSGEEEPGDMEGDAAEDKGAEDVAGDIQADVEKAVNAAAKET